MAMKEMTAGPTGCQETYPLWHCQAPGQAPQGMSLTQVHCRKYTAFVARASRSRLSTGLCVVLSMIVLSTIASSALAGTSLVQGRMAFAYNGKEYPGAAAACRARLADLSPPESLQQAYPPETGGEVRCVGKPASQDVAGFDMFGSGVRYTFVCPPNASQGSDEAGRPTCTCDGDLVGKGSVCVNQAAARVSTAEPPAQPPSPASPMAVPPGNPLDPCLDQKKGMEMEPNKNRCPLSWRAFDIRRYLAKHGGVHPAALTRGNAVAVGIGRIDGQLVTIIGTSNLKIHELIKNLPVPLLAGERIVLPPAHGRHAEEVVEASFAIRKVDKSAGVCIGSDPQACVGNCTPRYQNHDWVAMNVPKPVRLPARPTSRRGDARSGGRADCPAVNVIERIPTGRGAALNFGFGRPRR